MNEGINSDVNTFDECTKQVDEERRSYLPQTDVTNETESD